MGVMVDMEVGTKLAILLDKPFEYADFSQLAARYDTTNLDLHVT